MDDVLSDVRTRTGRGVNGFGAGVANGVDESTGVGVDESSGVAVGELVGVGASELACAGGMKRAVLVVGCEVWVCSLVVV